MGLLREDIPQWKIRATHGKMRPSRMLFIDTETKQQRDGSIEKHRMKMAWTLYCQKRADRGKDTLNWLFWLDPLDMQKYIESLAKDKTVLYVFGHNIFFDLQCSDFFYHFTKEGWILDFHYDKGLTYILNIHKGKKRIKCLSTTNYFPVALKSLGKIVGLHKIDVDFEGDSFEDIKRYCKRDVEIIHRGIERYIDFLDLHDLGNFMGSRAGQSLCAYRHRFMDTFLYVHRSEEISEFERLAYFGGRVECFQVGKIRDGPFISLDINSMYPFVMRNKQYPTQLIERIIKPDNPTIRSALRRHCVIAKVYLETDTPIYPIRWKNKIIFPIGCFPAYLCTEGLDYALSRNDVIHIDEMLIYEKGNIFTRYVDYFYDLKKKYTKENEPVMKQFTKDFLNSLYGKFAQKKTCIEEEEDLTCDGYYREEIYDIVTGKTERLTKLFNKRIIEYGEETAKNSLVAISAHVTEYARFHLWRLMEKVGRENVLYVDTDSIKMRKKHVHLLEDEIHEEELGKLKIEEEFSQFTIHGLKDYETEHLVKMKGVPKRAEKIEEGKYKYISFPRQSTHLQKQVTRYFIARETIKTLKREYTKGVVLKNGKVKPLKIRLPYEPF